ncbi:MAG: 1,4-dihydroxy-6-naphthoate synthase [Mariniblastus sp.]|jgi:1,4-dihydroxy-6-naphthoate synthase
MSTKKIRLAISTCPNDTFAFHGVLERKVDWLGVDFEIQLLDIQQLNDGLFRGEFDVAKASFHAAALLADRTYVLPSGAALGFGVGPLLLAARPEFTPDSVTAKAGALTLCPGRHTTAALLYQLFYGDSVAGGKTRVEHALFSEIMPKLQRAEADFGVCIHEGRFTWQAEGLFLVEDLGMRWEADTDSPLPLGGILASRELGEDLVGKIQAVVKSSVEYGLANRAETLSTMKKYAQEFEDDVLYSHVDLYVNDWTVELGDVGERALSLLSQKVREQGLQSPGGNDIQVWKPS